MEFPSDYIEGDISSNIVNTDSNLNTKIIINTGIFDHSIIIQNINSEKCSNYKNKEEISSEITEIDEIKEKNGLIITPDVTEVDEMEERNDSLMTPEVTEVDEKEKREGSIVTLEDDEKKENDDSMITLELTQENKKEEKEGSSITPEVTQANEKEEKEEKDGSIITPEVTVVDEKEENDGSILTLEVKEVDEKKKKDGSIITQEETKMNETEERNISKNEILNEKENFSELKRSNKNDEESILKVEIVNISKDCTEIKEKKNDIIDVDTEINDYLVENSNENIKDHEKEKVSNNMELELPRLKSDNGLWWLFAKPDINKNQEKISNNISTSESSPLTQESKSKINENGKNEYNSEISTTLNEKDINNSSSTVVYIIVSCPENYLFENEFISIIPYRNDKIKIKDKELNLVKIKNKNFYNEIYSEKYSSSNKILDSLGKKNVYLFKLNLELDCDKGCFNIMLKYFSEDLISKSTYSISRGQHLFIDNEIYSYKYKSYGKILTFSYYDNSNYKKYKISALQHFIIFEYYLKINNKKDYILLLLDQYLEVIKKEENFDFELILELLNIIIDSNNISLNLQEINKQDYIRKILLNLEKKKKIINVKNYSNERYNEVINEFENYNSDSDEQLNLYLNLFILIYITSNNYSGFENSEKFNKIFNKIYLKENAFKFIKKHKTIFPNLKSSNLELFFDIDTNKNKFDDILALASDYNEYLRFFCLKREYILNEKPKIDFKNIPKPNENVEISLLIQFIEILYSIDLGRKNQEKIFNNIKQLIEQLEKKDLNKLYELRKIANEFPFEVIINKINYAIHTTGKIFIEGNKLSNIDIIRFLHEDKFLSSETYNYAKLIGNIDINKVDDTFCYEFNTSKGYFYDYMKLFRKDYKVFINSIINCAKNYEQFKILYKIFDIENTYKYIDLENNKKPPNHIFPIIESLIEHIEKLDKNNVSTEELGIIFGTLFKVISENENHSINKLLKVNKKIFKAKENNEIYAIILDKQSGNLNRNIVEKLIQSMDELSSDDVILYLNNFENITIKKLLLQKLDKNIVSEKEIFDRILSDNMKTLRALVNMNYFDEDNEETKKINYIKKTREIMNSLAESLEQFEFSMSQLQSMNSINYNINSENSLKNRLLIISLGKQSLADELYQLLNSKISEYVEIFRKIGEIITNFVYYYPNDKRNVIEFYKKIKEEITENFISMFPDMNSQNDFDDLYNEAHEISLLKSSKFFIEIFEKTKKESLDESDHEIIEKTKNKFFNLKNLFDSSTENKVDFHFLEDIIIKFQKYEIDKEINELMKIFKIDKKPLNNICEKLKNLIDKNKNIILLKNTKKLLRDFGINKILLRKNIKIIIKELEGNFTLESIEESYKKLYNLELKIFDSDLNLEARAVINEMYDKPELMEFIIDKKIEDINQMGEFIDDIEDIYITLADINQLESCIAFIEELKHQNHLNEIQFLNNFIEIVKMDKYKDIGIKFKDVSGKYADFNELYTNYLNPNELNKVHIELIHNSSTFNIQYTDIEYKYNCKVKYKSNDGKCFTKDFNEMLDLRDVALLRKKDHKEKYFIICDRFAEIITDIEEIFKLLNIIDSKGYFEKINFIIKVYNGNALDEKNRKNLKEIIEELKNINQSQIKELKESYENYPITRLIYGRQFRYLNEYISSPVIINNINDQLSNILINNILKYCLNNNYKFEFRGIVNKIKEDSSLKKMFKSVYYYLNALFKMNNINIKTIFKDALLLNDSNKGIYTHSSSIGDIECDIIYCSLNLTGNFPLAQTILYCNNSTSEEELISFIFKSIKCDFSVLFMLIKPENLSIEMKTLLIQLIKEYYFPEEIKSCLLILYTKENKTNEIITEIEKISYNYTDIKIINKDKNKDRKFPSVEIYSSDICGLGKSTLIKNNFERNHKDYEYIYLPIGDTFDKNDIIERLLKLPNKKIGLHLDIYNCNQIELIREFLFMFLILKYYSKNDYIFYYGKEIEIKVEIPNGFLKYKEIFKFFKFFENIHIATNKLQPLIVSNDISSKIQIICNYLYNIDSINNYNIYIKGVSNNNSSNEISAKSFSQEQCQNLIFQNLNIENPNYYQIVSFINIVAEQLLLLTNSYYINIDQLNLIKQYKRNSNLNKIRKFFVESLVKITKHFVTSSYDNIIKGQKVTYKQQNGEIDLEKANQEANEILEKKLSFSINQIRPSMILINEDGQSLSIIVTCNKNTEEYNLLKAIYNSGSINENKDIGDYTQLTHEQFLMEARKVLNLYNKLDKSEKGYSKEFKGKKLKYLKDIADFYIFTADNFIKLLQISLRLRTNIPVVMMGETGCGKTSLIKIMAELKGIEMKVLNIHAGIDDKNIIEFLEENDLFGINDSQASDEGNNIWVFLDEINTCNSLGLITEIMLKHSCKGKKLKSNIKFIAACNPYRIDTGEKEIIGLYDETKYINRKLVYNVNPLPDSLLNFVFDFKAPEKEDIKRYIENIVHKTLTENISDNEIFQKIKIIAVNSLFNAHEFIKTQFDISSVSLREIRRWQILFKWFIQFLRKPIFKNNKFKNYKIYLYSLNLSIYLCYYMRLFKKEKRQKFLDIMKESFGENFKFEKIPRMVQEKIADATELERGIAKNRPLLENLFAIFVCLNTKIPLFIVGKPGCSKTLSAQLIFKSMKGKDSSNEFFKEFPKVYTKSYQGSLNSNSSGISKIFKKARNSLKDKSLKLLSVFYFDEMGLAEISNNNPLKVIHHELEYDDNEEKISFIGISNWPLDASKMNRGIYLSIPEPDEEDLKITALSIAESYDSKLKQNYYQYLEYMAYSYFEYKNQLKEFPYKFNSFESSSSLKYNNNINEFHGTRDYYHLIKTFSKLIIDSKFPHDSTIIEDILSQSIERNFGGLENSIKVFKEILQKYIPNFKVEKKYNTIKCIKSNIINKSRYLLLINNSPIDKYLILNILNELKKKHTFYYGSKFKEDISKGYYSAKILNKIQVTMSNEDVMLLKDLESMYPCLYDFFNQNFRKIGNSKYARVALGDANTQNYYVNENHICIVLLDKNNINKQDPPFLNRFEKHIITFEYLLNDKQIEISKKIYKLICDLIKEENDKELKINLKSELINCNLEEFQGLIYQLSNKFKNEEDQYEKYKNEILEKIVPTFSQDLIFYAKNSFFAKKYKEEFEIILNIYCREEQKHQNLNSYLKGIDTEKHIIYTFSNILDYIFKNKNDSIENSTFGKFTEENTKNIFVNQYNSERAIEGIITEYYNNENCNLCIFHFNSDNYIHINNINYLISNNEIRLDERKLVNEKVILFIIHLKRTILDNGTNKLIRKFKDKNKDENIHNDNMISHLAEWKQFFIDNLNGEDIKLREIFEVSNKDLFNNEKLIDIEEEFRKDLFHAFTHISYNYKCNFSSFEYDEYIERVCEFINNNEDLKNTIQNCIKRKIENIEENILYKIYTDYIFEESDIDFISIVIKYLKSIYNDVLIDTLIQFEKNNILSTKLLNEDIFNNKWFNEVYNECINKFDLSFKKYSNLSDTIKIDLFLGLSYPCIISIFKKIKFYINPIINDYKNNENKIRFELYDKNYSYDDNKKFLEDNLKIEFEKYYIDKIFKNNDDFDEIDKHQLMENLFKDYIIFYLSISEIECNNKNLINFFNSLYNHFTLNDKLTIENLTKFILFIESYKDYIKWICYYISIMDNYINNFSDNYNSLISSNLFEYENKEISCVNNILYKLFESFIYCILNQEHIPEILLIEENNELYLNLKQISQEIMKINNELRLTLKQILYLNDLILIYDFFKDNNLINKYLPTYYELLKKQNSTYAIKINGKSFLGIFTKDPIVEEFDFLHNKFLNIENYNDLLVKLINNKSKVSKDEKYREKLISIICSNDSLIINSKIILETILRKFHLCPIDNNEEIQVNDDESNEDSDYEDSSEDSDYEDSSEDSDYEESELDSSGYENSESESSDSEDYEYRDNEAGLLFLYELKDEKNNSIIKLLNKTNKKCLDEVLISIFDKEISKYFKKKKSKETMILSQSLEKFKYCIEYVEKEKSKIKNNNRLGILYCISYIKYYSYYFSKIIYKEKNNELLIEEVARFLKSPSKFKSVIKIYILKILNKIFIGNYKETVDFIKRKKLFNNDFNFSIKTPYCLDYLFIQNNLFKKYQNLKKQYVRSKNENFNFSKINIIKSNDIEENKMDTIINFYNLIMNEEISYLKNYFDEIYYHKLSDYISTTVNEFSLPSLSEKILKLYYDVDTVKNQLSFIKDLSLPTFEMLLYSHKMVFICSLSKPNTVYSNILSPNVLNNLKNIFIPGGEPKDSLLIKSGDEIYEHFQNGSKDGIYMCSCNYYYTINNCGFPMKTFPCENCGKLIGGENHKLINRQGHVRIFKDEDQRKNDIYINHYGFSVPYIYLNELMEKVKKDRETSIKGFRKVKKSFFKDNEKKIRYISIVTYRILVFIFYSCIYHNFRLGYLNQRELENFFYLDSNETIVSIMKDNWEMLIKELKNRNIDSIQCFLNLIIPEISKIILENDKSLKDYRERDEFEIKCNNVIENIISTYKDKYNIYIDNNKKLLQVKDDTIESILQETSNLEILSSKTYPLINYFNVVNYPDEDSFIKEFKKIENRSNKYPIITSYLEALHNRDTLQIMKIFNLINPFITYVLDKYDNKISRKEAKSITIEEELRKDSYMEKLFNAFQKGWKKIYKKIENYDCNEKLPIKKITKEDCLAYILNDREGNNYGVYIASAYKVIITCQNNFLYPIIKDKKEITVQKANSKEIVSLKIEDDQFDSFDDMIYTFCNRSYYYGNGHYDYLNYKNIIYDYDNIEKELSRILLTDKKLLKEEKEQQFINYAFEAFNQEETIIARYKEKIKNLEILSSEEKRKLKHEISGIDYKIIIFNLQSLFLYYINKKNITGEELLSDEISKLPNNIFKLDETFKNIFQYRYHDLKLNKLIDCYEYIEEINFDKILKNVPRNNNLDYDESECLNEYINAYAQLKEDQIEQLNSHFENKEQLVNKINLSNAVRKYISRYMVTERFKKFEKNIIEEIRYRQELWNDEINSEDNEFNEEMDKLMNMKIKISQSINLYKFLKDGDETNNKKLHKHRNKYKKDIKGKRKLDY